MRPVRPGNDSSRPVFCFPIWVYHCLPILAMRPHGASGWSGDHYHCLPTCRSESEPRVWNLYQRLPPRCRRLTIDLAVGVVGVVWPMLCRVITRENRGYTQKGSARWSSASKRKSSHRPVGLQKIEHGGKTGRAMIKYPHTKKNAQQENRSAYPGR